MLSTAVSLTTTEMWLEDSTDSGTGTRRLTQSGKDSLPLEMSAIECVACSPQSMEHLITVHTSTLLGVL